ncbi:unnamed protein product [Adineta steineri]|uniref:RelA/SpoT domain-containing protein n=1 Tax=Adineta steineri TaxID=433720 RepID=A0A818UXN4_9BILA|nr:unnamed protein product [Adineta steineri]CAF3704582.1 unnamed protein product [Adineta steineri]
MLLFVLSLFLIFYNCSCCFTNIDESCQQVTYRFETNSLDTGSKKWKCANNKIVIAGITDHGQYLITSNFHDFGCMDAYGMKCFEKYLKRCISSTTPHVVDICYIRNNNYKSDIYQLISSVNQKPPKSMLEFESMLDKLNATGEITEVIDNKMFELHYPLQQQIVLDYYKYVLHADANVLSCLMGELYDFFANSTNFSFRITGRLKTPYSFWSKLVKRQKNVDDLFSFTVLVKTIDECYEIFNILQKNYVFKKMVDYIKNPTSNGYESIHATLFGLYANQCIEIQIKTEDMYLFQMQTHAQYKHEKYGDRIY